MPLTASCLNTIAEECILLLRTLYNSKSIKHKNATDIPSNFDSLIIHNLTSATDYLANPTLEKRETVSKIKFRTYTLNNFYNSSEITRIVIQCNGIINGYWGF